MAFGLSLYSLGWTAFLLPANIVSGGVSGIGALIYYATGGAEGGGIKIAYSYLVINVFLLYLGIKVLGGKFGVRTVIGIGMTAFLLWLGQLFIHSSPLKLPDERLLATIIGGGLCGTGLGLIFTQGGTSGGTDIIAMIVCKYRNISMGKMILLCDVIIIGSSYFILKDFTSVVYGYISVGVVSFAIDLVLQGTRQSVQMFIVSKSYDSIADRLSSEVGRGVTVLNGQGWYTKEEQKVVMVLVRKFETNQVYKICKQEDPNAFISVVNAMGVFGKGFETIKAK
ncbi:YitT family protein [uncultured Acetobacteroides sp.]|uniref:YitT family protein n=1 Tax=uncultured Acetobacteroides sp. TaxID=1760811 RepID=UPI0029F57C61|nr:YitT family protein [uncultured Acetobacteroides sp.]